MTSGALRVLYIAGWGRSGSTILDNILGQIDGFFSGGELRYVWTRGLVQNRRCGCGEHFADCPFWGEVLESIEGAPIDPSMMARIEQQTLRIRHVLPLLRGSQRLPTTRDVALSEYASNLGRFYDAIRTVSGCDVVVDSSKSPTYALALDRIPGIDLRVVHLVRDPRATAHSWLRKKVQLDDHEVRYMHSHGPIGSSVTWDVYNVAIEAVAARGQRRYLRVRYEDFAARPREVVERIANFAGFKGRGLPFVAADTVELDVNHTVSGNPSRFQSGAVRLRPDMEWQSGLSRTRQALVTSITLPLLPRYGYPIRLPSVMR